MKKENLFAEIMNYVVSGYVYFVAFTLVLYMVGSLVTGLLELGSNLLAISSSPHDFIINVDKDKYGYDLLHTIAFTIVLVKAYRILIAFAEVRYFNLKFLIEIAIIAPVIELLFNSRNYSYEMNILFAAFALLNLFVYLFFYSTIKRMNTDYEAERALVCFPKTIKKESKPKARVKSKKK